MKDVEIKNRKNLIPYRDIVCYIVYLFTKGAKVFFYSGLLNQNLFFLFKVKIKTSGVISVKI